jgi:hypothetical protein
VRARVKPARALALVAQTRHARGPNPSARRVSIEARSPWSLTFQKSRHIETFDYSTTPFLATTTTRSRSRAALRNARSRGVQTQPIVTSCET